MPLPLRCRFVCSFVLAALFAGGLVAPPAAWAQDEEPATQKTSKQADEAAAKGTTDGGEADATQVPANGRVIVASNRAAVQLQDADPRPVPPGTVFSYSIVNGPWLWSDVHWGWINRGDVVNLDEAEQHFTEIYEEALEAGDQKEARLALHHRGIARRDRGDLEEAYDDFNEATERGLESAEIRMNIADTLRQLGKLDEALQVATEAIKTNPDSSQAHHIRALVLFDQEQYDASLLDSDQAVKLDPENAAAVYSRGVTRRVMGQWRAAVEDYTRALKVSPRYAEALSNRGYVLKRLGRFKEAVRDYERALKIRSDLAVVHNDLAWLLATCPDEQIRDPALAIKHGKLALETGGEENGHFLDTLAAAYASAGDFEKATELGLQAIELLDEAEQFAADQRVALYVKGLPYVEK